MLCPVIIHLLDSREYEFPIYNDYCSYLDPKRVGNATEKLDMGTIELACTLTDPEEVSRAVIVETRGGVLTGEGLLIGEKQALMGGPKLSGCHDRMVHSEPSCSHEPKGLIHPVSQLLIPVSGTTTNNMATSAPIRRHSEAQSKQSRCKLYNRPISRLIQ